MKKLNKYELNQAVFLTPDNYSIVEVYIKKIIIEIDSKGAFVSYEVVSREVRDINKVMFRKFDEADIFETEEDLKISYERKIEMTK